MIASEAVAVRGQNLLGLSLFFDSNVVGNDLVATRFLVRLYLEGCIAIRISDAVATEQAGAPDELWKPLSEEAALYPEAFGVMVLDHSRLGSTVMAGEADVDLMHQLRAIIKPGIEDWSHARAQDVRDVMHVHTAIRYGAEGFVTLDGGILKKGDALAEYIRVWTPRQAGKVALKRLRNYRKRRAGNT